MVADGVSLQLHGGSRWLLLHGERHKGRRRTLFVGCLHWVQITIYVFFISLRVIWSFHKSDWVPFTKHWVQGESDILSEMGLYQTHFFKTGHQELGFLTYLIEVMPNGAVLTMINTLGSFSPLPFLPFTHLAHQGTPSYK